VSQACLSGCSGAAPGCFSWNSLVENMILVRNLLSRSCSGPGPKV
jgi:hypothetical protein